MTHPKSLEMMKKHLTNALENCQISNSWPVFESYSEAVEGLIKEVLKTKAQWLSHANIYRIYLDHVDSALREKYPNETEVAGSLKQLLGADLINDIAARILDFIESIPKKYFIYFPLPAVNNLGVDMVIFTDDISFGIFEIKTVPRGYLGGLLGVPVSTGGKVYLRIKSSGYAARSIEDSAFQDAVSKFKQVIHIGTFIKFFKKREVALSGLVYLPNYWHSPQLGLSATNPVNQDVEGQVDLPYSIASYLEKLTINEDLRGYHEAKTAGKDSLRTFYVSKFSDFARLLSTNDAFSVPIKSAIEWAFDANTNDNQTVSFVQACIGLEAILGDDVGDEPLTTTLADRCEYLLGRSLKSRKQIREHFRELYRIRSKVVHGKAVRLSDKDNFYLDWAKSVLDALIKKETTLIEGTT